MQHTFRQLIAVFTPLLIGIPITFVGAIWLVITAIFIMRASEAPGVVTKIDQRHDSSQWDLTFTFSDAEGIAYTAQTSFMSPTTCPAMNAGDSVTILYVRTAPEHAKVHSFATLWLEPLFFLGLGSFFVAGGYLLVLAVRFTARQRRAQIPAEPSAAPGEGPA